MDLSQLIERNAAFTPDKAAVVFEEQTLSYATFHARIQLTACALKSEFGVSRGDRVAVLSLNRPDYLALLYACARLGAMLVPLKDELVGKVSSQLKIAMGAVLLVLLITCVNVMCLLLARACERGPEVALRLSLGAHPVRILRQFVTENLVLVSMGSVFGVVLAAGILRLVRDSNFGNLPRSPHIGIDGYVLALAIGVAFIISLLLAWGPATIFRRLNLNTVLKSGRAVAGRPRAFRLLVISEVCCAIVLVVGAGAVISRTSAGEPPGTTAVTWATPATWSARSRSSKPTSTSRCRSCTPMPASKAGSCRSGSCPPTIGIACSRSTSVDRFCAPSTRCRRCGERGEDRS